jgi:predicted hydrocarbon binding protein
MQRQLTIEDVSKVRRPKLGPNYPVSFWRLVSLIAMPEVLGAQSPEIAYKLGYKIGEKVGIKSGQEIADVILGSGIGVTNPIEEREDFYAVEFSECFTCSGITPPAGIPLCHFEVGFVAGAVEKGLKKKIITIAETKCIGGLGHDVCRVEVTFE